MTSADPKPASFSFSIDDEAPRDPHDALRALNERNVVLRLDPLPSRRIRADIAQRSLGGIGLMSATLSGLRQGNPSPSAVQSRGEEVFFGVTVAGSSLARQRRREVELHDGDGVLLSSTGAGFTLSHPERVRFLGLRAPRSAIAPLVTNLEEAVMRVIPRDTSALRLLRSYARSVAEDPSLVTPELQQLVVTQLYDLLAMTIGATREAAASGEGRGVRAARLRAIVADVAANLIDGALNVTAVALRHGVTPRYIHKLFEGEGVTFGEFVLGQRLARAHRMLGDSRLSGRAISAIAYDVGFGDLSYFNRTFRRRYGATPSEVANAGIRS